MPILPPNIHFHFKEKKEAFTTHDGARAFNGNNEASNNVKYVLPIYCLKK